ncbi:hypothetical protein F4824DRAFT_507943 [Ustulina deusta]|nr:hypothetical protein F4824DRAFT_507943 [Ustulina deusta]
MAELSEFAMLEAERKNLQKTIQVLQDRLQHLEDTYQDAAKRRPQENEERLEFHLQSTLARKSTDALNPRRRNARKRAVKEQQEPFSSVIDPLAGGVYRAYWQPTKTWYAAIVLPIGDFDSIGMSGSIAETGLFKYIPVCYCFDKQARRITRWQKGYETGGPHAFKRKFPIMYLDDSLDIPLGGHFKMPEKDLFDWVPSKFLQPLDFQDPKVWQLDGYVSACNFHARQEARRHERAQRCSTLIDVHDGICGLSNNSNNASIGTDDTAGSKVNLAKVAEAALRLQASPDSRNLLVPAEQQAVGGNDVTQEDMVLQEHTQPKQSITRALKLSTTLNEAGEHFRGHQIGRNAAPPSFEPYEDYLVGSKYNVSQKEGRGTIPCRLPRFPNLDSTIHKSQESLPPLRCLESAESIQPGGARQQLGTDIIATPSPMLAAGPLHIPPDTQRSVLSKPPFVCEQCLRQYTNKTSLESHKRTVHVGTRCFWPNCSVTTAFEALMVYHLKVDHAQPLTRKIRPLTFLCPWPGCDKDHGTNAMVYTCVRKHNWEAKKAAGAI